MKKLVIAVLIFIGVADAAALYYLAQKQQKAQARLEESIQKDIDERWQIAQDVRNQVENKKQARDFIARMDYEKQMEDYNQKLEGYKATLDELNKKSQERISSLENAHGQIKDLTKQLESGFNQKLDDSEKKFSALIKQQGEASKELREINKQVKSLVMNMELSFERKLKGLEQKIAALSDELAASKIKPETLPVSPQ